MWSYFIFHLIQNYTAEAGHMPAFGVEVCPHFFITPVFSRMYPLLPCDVKQVAYQYKNGSHPSHVREFQISITFLQIRYMI